MRRSLYGGLALALLVGLPGLAVGALPTGRCALLPLQDRVGNPDLTQRAEALLRQTLEAHADLTDAETTRAILRLQRSRDASQEPPQRLVLLAEDLDADWFFLATIHEATRGREPRREDNSLEPVARFEDSGEIPQITLSAKIFQAGSPELWWAGFEAASGRDREGLLGLGVVETLDELLEIAVRNLVSKTLQAPPKPDTRKRLGGPSAGFLRSSRRPLPPGPVAVVPMDSVAEEGAGGSAATATAALFATLEDFGFRSMLPGLVRRILQESDRLQNGAVEPVQWRALAREGVQWVATGTVESYRKGRGRVPDPRVAFSVRLLETETGQIDWISGLERQGVETGTVFDRRRIYSAGDLTYEMMKSMVLRTGRAGGASETTGEN